MRNFKAGLKCVVFLVLAAVIVSLGDFFFMPSGYVRFILHELNYSGEKYNCIVLGASHARNAVNPYILDEKLECSSFNLSIPSETLDDSYYLLKESNRNHEIKRVFLEIDFQYWYELQKNDFKDSFIYYQMEPSPVKIEYLAKNMMKRDFRASLCSWTTYIDRYKGVGEKIALKRTKAYKDYDISAVPYTQANGPYKGKGYFEIQPSGHNGKSGLRRYRWYKDSMCSDTVKVFKKLVRYCKKNDIELVCFTAPITSAAAYANDIDEFSREFAALASEAEVVYYDFNLIKKEIFSLWNEDFGDWDGHMTGDTPDRFTRLLADVVNSGENQEGMSAQWFYKSYEELYEKYNTVLYVEGCLSWKKAGENYSVDLQVDTVYNPKYGEAEFRVRIYQGDKLLRQMPYSPELKYQFELPCGEYVIQVDGRMQGSSREAEEYSVHVLQLTGSEKDVVLK